MLPTNQYKEKYNLNQPIYHSTNSDLLFEGFQLPYPRPASYFSFSKGFSNRNIIDYHPNNIGPKRVLVYKMKTMPTLYNVDKEGIDLDDLKLFFQKKGLIFDEKANDDFKRIQDITYDSILKKFGKKFAPLISKYFENYDGLIENELLILFHPQDFLELQSIDYVDKTYLAIMELLNMINDSSNIYESTLNKISKKYDIKDLNSLKYLLMSNASKLNAELPNIQVLNKLVKIS